MIPICRAWEEAALRAGVIPAMSPIGLPSLKPHPGIAMDSMEAKRDDGLDIPWQRVNHQFETGHIREDEFLSELSRLSGLARDQVRAVFAAWLYEPYPGIELLIDRLTGHGCPHTACLSNTNTLHWSMMTRPGPARLPLEKLTYRFTSFEIGISKPDGGIYAHVEQATQVPPDQILFFDDLPLNVQAARDRRWIVYQIDYKNNPPQQIAYHLVQHGILAWD